VRIWDVPSDRLERTLKSPADVGRVGLDPTGRFLATCPSPPAMATPPALFLFDLAAPRTTEPIPLLGSEEGFFNQLQFSPDGSWLASTFASDAALWNVTGGHQTVIDRRKAAVESLAFTPDGDLLSGSADGKLRRWSLSPTAAEAVRDVWTRTGPVIVTAVDPGGRFAVTHSMMQSAVSLVPFDKSPVRLYEPKPSAGGPAWAFSEGLDRSGRFLTVQVLSIADRGDPELARFRVVDLSTNEERTIDVRPTADDGCQGVPEGKPGVEASVWLRDGRLVTDGYAGLRVWDHQAGTSVRLRPCWQPDPGRGMFLLASPDARTIVRLDSWGAQQSVSSLSAFDVDSRATREITSHGNAVEAATLDSRGAVLVTGDNNGLVRVGRVTGEEPHLLFGHTGSVRSVAVSPDGRWIASGGEDGTIRLWPMPDLSKPPLHTLPHNELLAKLRSLTNLRAVRDPASDTGWKIEIGPFPGWAAVPTWQP
jgi:WD40 repeat protein